MTTTYQPASIDYVRVVGLPTEDTPFGPVVSAASLIFGERLGVPQLGTLSNLRGLDEAPSELVELPAAG